ncbi:MAG: DNA-processing protein DprA [Candidatus Adiutrix sp.]|jgi:DNA processing protein|nr:DNA-processing protein DprA [Candidatus Adiutrix sp.]
MSDGLDNSERLARLALYLGLKTSTAAFHRVLRQLGSAVAAFEGHDRAALGLNLAPLLAAGQFEEAADRLEEARQSGQEIIIWGDENYPLRLNEIPDPPPVLWVKGGLEPGDQFAVCLVGSREAGPNGLSLARRLARDGARMGLTIVSGLARGIDAEAHLGALEGGGRTLAVLGSGLNWVYPKENARLYQEIAASGALISEFPPETKPLPVYFPRRNRVVAGLSLAVVVVEAGERSGALITARLGLELNREVMALPGPAGAASVRGTNSLIKRGAALVESMAEVVAEIKPRLLEGLTPPAGVVADRPGPLEDPGPPPGGPEAEIMAGLARGPLDIDSLTRATGIGVADLTLLLLNLELSGQVARLESGQFALAK